MRVWLGRHAESSTLGSPEYCGVDNIPHMKPNLLLILILFAGCDVPPAPTPQKSPAAIEQPQATIQPTKPATSPESPPEADGITGKVDG